MTSDEIQQLRRERLALKMARNRRQRGYVARRRRRARRGSPRRSAPTA